MAPKTYWTDDVIFDIMSDYNIDPNSVPKRFRFQSVHGYGFYRCTGCARGWSSYWVWMSIDLVRQRVSYRFKQKCNKCQSTCVSIVTPKEFSSMMDFICSRYVTPKPDPIIPPSTKGSGGSDDGADDGTNDKPTSKPHPMDLCEKCGFGTLGACWKRRAKGSKSKKNRKKRTALSPGGGDNGVNPTNGEVNDQPLSGQGEGNFVDDRAQTKKHKKTKSKKNVVGVDNASGQENVNEDDAQPSKKKKNKRKKNKKVNGDATATNDSSSVKNPVVVVDPEE